MERFRKSQAEGKDKEMKSAETSKKEDSRPAPKSQVTGNQVFTREPVLGLFIVPNPPLGPYRRRRGKGNPPKSS